MSRYLIQLFIAFYIRMRLLHLLFLLTCCSLLQAQPCREVVAFFPSWKWYNRSRLVNPSTIDYSKYTVINYAFFKPNDDGSISLFDPLADKTILLGAFDKAAPKSYRKNELINPVWHIPGTSLVEKAHANGVKVLISIGGWTLSDKFSSIAGTPTKRAQFAKSCIDLVNTYHIDGVDIDWEYPGYKSQFGKSKDKENFTLLLQEIRTAFDQLQEQLGKRLLLTADFGAGASHLANIEWERVIPLLDHINVMTYDYYGNKPSRTNHHAPLYAPRKGVEGYDLNSTVRHLMEKHQVPANKINIGLAFFGRSLRTRGKANIHTATQKAMDTKTFSADKGAPTYYNLIKKKHLFDYHWDEFAEVPYLKGKKLKTFVTFDDEKSIQVKGRYIVENKLCGALVWDITNDYVESESTPGTIEYTPLADALNKALCEQETPEVVAYVEPRRQPVIIENLPQQWSPLTHRTFAPRLAHQPLILKKEKKKKKRRRKKKKKKNALPNRYFDGGW